jgi:PKD repeat protein
VFNDDNNALVYYLSGTSGWSSTFGGVPAVQLTSIATTVNPTNGVAPLAVNCNSASVDSAGHSVNNWIWNFGDGAISAIQNPPHTYNAVGTFAITLIETNSSGLPVAGSASYVTVTSLPTVILSAPQIAVGQTDFTFQLSGPAGGNFELQVSTNLLNWSPVSTSTIPASGIITLTNATTGYNRGFYRVYLQ